MRYLAGVFLVLLLTSLFVFAQTDTPPKDAEQKKMVEPSEKDLHEILEAFHESDRILRQNVAYREFVEVEATQYPGLELDIVPIGQQVFKPRMENVLKMQAQDEYMLYRSYDYTRSLTGRPQKSGRLFEIPVTSILTSSDDDSEGESEPED